MSIYQKYFFSSLVTKTETIITYISVIFSKAFFPTLITEIETVITYIYVIFSKEYIGRQQLIILHQAAIEKRQCLAPVLNVSMKHLIQGLYALLRFSLSGSVPPDVK